MRAETRARLPVYFSSVRTKTFIAVCLLLVIVFAGGAGVYAYDQARADEIAKGVRVHGIDIGGMTRQAAAARLERELLAPLSAPIVVRYRGKRFKLTAGQARVGVDVDATVRQALDRSREGNLITRTARGLTGGEVHASLPVRVVFDRTAVRKLVARIAKTVDQPAVDATADITVAGISVVKSRNGRKLKSAPLRRAIEREIVSFDRGTAPLRARSTPVKPKVTTEQVAQKYPTVIVVNRGAFRLTLYKNLSVAKTYRIAVGQAGLETPAGLYDIENKQIDPAWHVPDSDWAGDLAGEVIAPGDPRNPLEARWMGIIGGAGIHGTTSVGSLGSAASHGCVRMAIPDVIDLFDRVEVGTPVLVA